MTPKQITQFNEMLNALKVIATYETPAHLRKHSFRDWGLDYEEALEMSYENIMTFAKTMSKGIKPITEKPN